jgi:translation initiation factor IF-3
LSRQEALQIAEERDLDLVEISPDADPIAQKVIEDFGDAIIVDQQPQLAGKQLNFVIRSSGKKPAAAPATAAKEGEQDA